MRILVILICTVLNVTTVQAKNNVSDDARAALEAMHKQAAVQLTGNNLSDGERRDRFRKLLHQWFDLDKISQFILGRYWRGATKDEQISFRKYFEDYLVLSYADSFKSYTSNQFKVLNVSTRGKNNNTAIVSTEIKVNQGGSWKPVKVDWRMKFKNGKFVIRDIAVENVSMSITRRKEFAAIINKSGGKVHSIIHELIQKTKPMRVG